MQHDEQQGQTTQTETVSVQAPKGNAPKATRRRAGTAGVIDTLKEDKDVVSPMDEMRAPTWHEFSRKPLKYEAWMPQFAYDLYTNAKGPMVITKELLAVFLHISPVTLYDWIRKQSEFALAVSAGETHQVARLASLMCSSKYSNGIFGVMKNVHKWTDRIDESHNFPDLREQMKKASEGAKRVDWDKKKKFTDVLPPAPLPPALLPPALSAIVPMDATTPTDTTPPTEPSEEQAQG